MSHHHVFGAHHSHFQPRHADGTFVSYAQAGRRLGQVAVSSQQRIVVTERRIHGVPAR